MNKILVFATCFAAPLVASAQVSMTVNEPTNNSNQISPITVSATSASTNGPSGWEVYVDNTRVLNPATTTPPGRLDTTFTASPGTHNVVIKAYDNSGLSTSQSFTVNVNASPFPTIPSSATAFANVQQKAGGFYDTWNLCQSTCAGSSDAASGNNYYNFGIASPSLSGGSMQLVSNVGAQPSGNTNQLYWNVLGYRHLGCLSGGCTAGTNFMEDMWFNIPTSDTALQATEYDPGVFVDGYKLFASMQCDSATGLWRFWNSNRNDWTVKGIDASGNETVTIPTYSCSILNQKGSWHHYQLYVTMDFTAHKIAYKSFAVDGTVVYQNLGNTYNALSLSGDATINIEQQLDSRVGAAAFTNSEYLDNYNLWVW